MVTDPKEPEDPDESEESNERDPRSDAEQLRREAQARLPALEATLQLAMRKLGTVGWRVANDLVDLTMQRVEARLLSKNRPVPKDLFAYAVAVLRNLAGRRPPSKLSRTRTEFLSEVVEVAAEEQPQSSAHLPELAALHELIKTHAAHLVTEAEHAALLAILDAKSMKLAAKTAGMTARDLRNRYMRAVKKLRKFLGVSRPPPPFDG
ncbi:MAG: hypothetical protein AB7I19_06210 [Planctomycetota bacterium]